MPLMRAFVLGFLILLAPGVVIAQPASIQETLLKVRPAVVLVVTEVTSRVSLDCGSGREIEVVPTPFRETGTGWFVAADGSLVTNASAVAAALGAPDWVRDHQLTRAVRSGCFSGEAEADDGARPRDLQGLEEATRRILAAAGARARVSLEPSVTIVLASGRRLPATILTASPFSGAPTAQDLALLKVGLTDSPTLRVADSAAAKLGDPVHIVGHAAVVLSHELLDRSAAPEPSVTNGTVSGHQVDRAGRALIQTDAPAWGTSGGPAVDHHGRVIGMLAFVGMTGVDGSEVVQGFNFLIPAAAVREFLTRAGADLGKPSRFDAAWSAGLAAFFAGRHSEAARRFEDAERLLPGLPDLARIAEENDRLRWPATRRRAAWWAAGVAIVVLAGGMTTALIVRRGRDRLRIQPAAAAVLLASETPPLVIDARDDTTYARSPVRLPRALHISPSALEAGTASVGIEPGRTVIAYCS
jgi:S1-C subfamily serine protease